MAAAGKFAFVVFVALVNLGLGFGIAVLLGRGPWSRTACPVVPEGAASPPVPEPTSNARVADPTSAESSRATELIQIVSSELEQAEQRIERLLSPPGNGDTSQPRLLDEWRSVTHELAGRFQAVAAGLGELPDTTQLAPEMLRKTTNVLETLSGLCSQSDTVNQPPEQDFVKTAAQTLLEACREARGTMNAVLFYQQL